MDHGIPLDHIFLESPTHNDVLSELIKSKLGDILALVPPPAKTNNSSSCLLEDIGDYLTRSLAILAHLAEDLTNGPHIEGYAHESIDRLLTESDFSELGTLEYMSSKHASLRCVL
jgi:hypothetical protein